MTLDAIVARVTNPYERQARLYPALLCLLPLLVLISLLYAPRAVALTDVAAIAVSCGGLFLMMNICREMGKRLEGTVFREWGGVPTTQLLRHRNNVIDSVTKHRYHAFLAKKIGTPYPDVADETRDPQQADETYQSGVRWLLDHTRLDAGKQFDLLFRENVTYGFRRNALGAKPIGIAICVGCIAWALAKSFGELAPNGQPLHLALLGEPSPAIIPSLGVSGIMLLIWLLFFTKASLRTSPFSFAQTLLRTCDVLE